jgi:DNA-binding transcriptional regulator YiaG
MPNIGASLKEEIRCLAEKEAKALVTKLKRSLSQQEREIKPLKKQQGQVPKEEPLESVRFSARSVKAQRSRLGLSAADYGKLVGVSGLTIYNWEHGTSHPRKAQLAALVAVRNIGKKEAMMKLAGLEAGKKGKRR